MFIYLFSNLFIYLFTIIHLSICVLVCFFICFFFLVLSRERYPSSHVRVYIVCCFYWLYVYYKSLVFYSFIYPPWDSWVKTRICPPYPHATGKGDLNGAVFLNNRKKVGPVLVLCFFITFLFACLFLLLLLFFFFVFFCSVSSSV